MKNYQVDPFFSCKIFILYRKSEYTLNGFLPIRNRECVHFYFLYPREMCTFTSNLLNFKEQ